MLGELSPLDTRPMEELVSRFRAAFATAIVFRRLLSVAFVDRCIKCSGKFAIEHCSASCRALDEWLAATWRRFLLATSISQLESDAYVVDKHRKGNNFLVENKSAKASQNSLKMGLFEGPHAIQASGSDQNKSKPTNQRTSN